MKIKSPATNYTGNDQYGSTVLEFKDGVAEVDELPAGVRLYLQGAGYGIDAAPETPEVEAPVDPRGLESERVGTALRDAAVDPREEDFLPPVNAGKEGDEGNPHGPNVIAPGIHAATEKVVVPGVVSDDTDKQEAKESQAAGTEASEAPAGNASKDAWHAYALTQGYTEEGLEGRTRDEIRALINEE